MQSEVANSALYRDVVELRVTMMEYICISFFVRSETSLEFTYGTISEGAFAKSGKFCGKCAEIRFIALGKSAVAESFQKFRGNDQINICNDPFPPNDPTSEWLTLMNQG